MIDTQYRELSLAGIRIDALEYRDLINLVEKAKFNGDNLVIFHHNLHSLYLYHTDEKFRAAYSSASSTYIDGMPVVWSCQLAGLPMTRKHRITFLDCFHSILSDAEERGWRVFYLGSSPEVSSEGVMRIRSQHPRLIIDGHHGFFEKNGTESERVIAEMNRFGADVVFIGMGMPVQEVWLAEYAHKIKAAAILTSGATLDYVTGHAYRPPAWAGRLGLYGVFRLFSDPSRLWRRYLIEPITLTKHLALPLIRQRMRSNARQKQVQL